MLTDYNHQNKSLDQDGLEEIILRLGSTSSIYTALTALNVGGFTETKFITLTRPADTTQYTAGDIWNANGSTTPASFAPFKGAGKTGVLLNILCTINANQDTKPDLIIQVYGSAPTGSFSDNAPSVLADPDQRYLLAVARIQPTDWLVLNPTSGTGGVIAAEASVRIPEALKNLKVPASNLLWTLVNVNNDYTPTSGEILTLDFGISQDA